MPGSSGASRRLLAEELSRKVLLLERRLGRGLDRARLARRLNISPSSLYAYLNGTTLPRSGVFDELLHALEVTGPELRRLSMLRDEIDVAQQVGRSARRAPADGGTPGAAAPPPALRQLPPRTGNFVGRVPEQDGFDDLIAARPSPIVVLDGMAGVGKTTLAVHLAHRVAGEYRDGQLYADLRGFGSDAPLEPDQVLHGFLTALGVRPDAVPQDAGVRAALFRSLTAGRRLLLLLDNARTTDQVRPLLPGPGRHLVIVTSRRRLDGLVVHEGARHLSLESFSYRESMLLLGRMVGDERLDVESTAADELVDLCGRLPLALAIAAARAGKPGRSLRGFVERLRDVRTRLDAFASAEPGLDVHAIFHASYALLPPGPARLFRLLGTCRGPGIDVYAAAALTGEPVPAARAHLDALSDAHLLAERSDGRFGMHDLLRAFASRLTGEAAEPGAAANGTTAEGEAALRRCLGYYAAVATQAARRIRPCRSDELPAVEPAGPAPPIDTLDAAMTWFHQEFATVRAMIARAVEAGHDPPAWQLAWACTVYLRRTGRQSKRVRLHRLALAAAQRSAGPLHRATGKRLLADGLARTGRTGEALGLLREALAECAALGDARGEFQTRLSLVRANEARSRLDDALEQAEEALAMTRGLADPLARADALNALGRVERRLGRPDDGFSHATRAAGLYRRIGFSEGEADALRTLGHLEQDRGRHRQAIRHLERSLMLDRRLGDRYWEARALADLADSREALGDLEGAGADRRAARSVGELLEDHG